jgi:hypothetical protein
MAHHGTKRSISAYASMPRYFLDIVNGDTIEDPDGAEFGDIAEAREEAVLSARDLIGQDIKEGRPLGLTRRIDIRDDNGQVVDSVIFSEAIPSEEQ